MPLNISLPDGPDTPHLRPRITVIGVGGAGGNAVNNMIDANLNGVDFVVANTDAQALTHSRTSRRIQLGTEATQGLGAGARPEIGRMAAEEAVEAIAAELQGANMVFITAGMGGGTGTGAAPVVASVARELGILTVGVVTKPFQFEGVYRMRLAEAGIDELAQFVDTLIVIPNQNLFHVANEKTTFADAFKLADDVLYSGVRSVTDLMINPGLINLDFADVRTVMHDMGRAMMGTGEAEGERRALDAAEAAIANPLLEDTSMRGARGVLINITGGTDVTLYEVDEAANRIRDEVETDTHIIFGSSLDESLNGRIRVAVVATGISAEAMGRSVPVEREAPVQAPVAPVQARRPGPSGPTGPGGPSGPGGGHPAPGRETRSPGRTAASGLVSTPVRSSVDSGRPAATAPAASRTIAPQAHHAAPAYGSGPASSVPASSREPLPSSGPASSRSVRTERAMRLLESRLVDAQPRRDSTIDAPETGSMAGRAAPGSRPARDSFIPRPPMETTPGPVAPAEAMTAAAHQDADLGYGAAPHGLGHGHGHGHVPTHSQGHSQTGHHGQGDLPIADPGHGGRIGHPGDPTSGSLAGSGRPAAGGHTHGTSQAAMTGARQGALAIDDGATLPYDDVVFMQDLRGSTGRATGTGGAGFHGAPQTPQTPPPPPPLRSQAPLADPRATPPGFRPDLAGGARAHMRPDAASGLSGGTSSSAAAESRQAPPPPPPPPRSEKPSLLARITGLGGRNTDQRQDSHRDSNPPLSAKTLSATPDDRPVHSHDDDHLDIPTFLRRQAN